ncbi:GIDE domain-containing protein [Saccharopolyspora taberi]|uniref:RING-type E3 ubiquitin transferase n=1 Tax=Saccharopolyspora taberi TaxID=60895 RepID=A0ABN3V185_9PSEU
MPLIVIGSLLLLLVPVGLTFVFSARRDLRAVRGAATLTGQELETRRRAGAFREYCAFVGKADARATGIATSHFGRTPCAWYRYQVVEHYQVREISANGRRWVPREQVVFQHSAPGSVVLRDSYSAVRVDLHEVDADQPTGLDQVFHLRPDDQRAAAPSAFGIQVPAPTHGGRTTGYEYREWVVRPDQQLYVLGEASNADGSIAIGKPAGNQRFLVSTQTGGQLEQQGRRNRNGHLGCVTVVGVLGIVLLALGLFVM